MRYKYKLTTLTPIHIGSGDKIFPLEYVLDDKFYRIDMEKLFADEKFDREEFIQKSTTTFFYLGAFQPDIAKKYTRYEIDLASSVCNSLKQQINRESPNSQISEFIKSGGSPFIPGTSIKGAIRTAILWQALHDPNALKQAEEIALKQAEEMLRKQKRVDPRKADEEIEKHILGKDPNHDLLRALQVSDTQPQPIQHLKISEIKTLTTTLQGHGWKTFITFAEGFFNEQTELEGEIKIDNWLLYGRHLKGENKEIPTRLKFVNKQSLLENIPRICNDFAKDLIDNEFKFYHQYNHPPELNSIINQYQQLTAELKNLKHNEFLLHFAWGSGWHSMTIGRKFQEDKDFDFFQLRKMYSLGKRRNEPYFVKEFPKTRKIIFENKQPALPLGWVKLSLQEMK